MRDDGPERPRPRTATVRHARRKSYHAAPPRRRGLSRDDVPRKGDFPEGGRRGRVPPQADPQGRVSPVRPTLRSAVRVPARVEPLAEPVQEAHVLRREVEVEDAYVLADALGPHGFRDHDDPVLEGPAERDLRRRASVLRRDVPEDGVAEPVALREGAVRLQDNPVLLAEPEEVRLVQEGAELDLVP